MIRVDGKELLDFCSNDYLGLANHDQVKQTLINAVNKYGTGATASQLISGYTDLHQELEQYLADWMGYEKVILFGNGYLANLAVIQALTDKNSVILGDRLNHASLVDAALASTGKFKRYLHSSTASLNKKLQSIDSYQNPLVITDAVFSMDGDIAPLPEYTDMCAKAGACLFVDDAHGFGIMGKHGKGTRELFGLTTQDIPVMMATFGKALGTHGAFVASDADIIEHLLQTARTLIYTTAIPPAWAAASQRALLLLEQESWRREKLHGLIKRFAQGAAAMGLPVLPSQTAIQPFIVGETHAAVAMSEALSASGFFIPAIRPPTVPTHSARLRITLSARHSGSDIDRLLDVLGQLWKQTNNRNKNE